ALTELGQVGADGEVVAGDVAGEMAVDADPVVRAVETVTIPLLAGRELRRQPRLLELEEVDASLVVNQLVTGGDRWRGDLEHAQSVRMFASNVQLIYTQKIQVNKLSGPRAVPMPPDATPPTPSQSPESAQNVGGGRGRIRGRTALCIPHPYPEVHCPRRRPARGPPIRSAGRVTTHELPRAGRRR